MQIVSFRLLKQSNNMEVKQISGYNPEYDIPPHLHPWSTKAVPREHLAILSQPEN
uniref:Uncharacterized protein n=1 Tax=Arion vulgaris TaxID=1028688 RepID=A0A0B7ASB4_9EUPU